MKVLTAGCIILVWVGSSFIQEKVYALLPDNNPVVQGKPNSKSAYLLIHSDADNTILHGVEAGNFAFFPDCQESSSQLNTSQMAQLPLGNSKNSILNHEHHTLRNAYFTKHSVLMANAVIKVQASFTGNHRFPFDE
jgi:hypothetical protein